MLCIETPSALGEAIEFEVGLRLVGIIAIGQNRWTFQTTCQGIAPLSTPQWKGRPASDHADIGPSLPAAT